MRLKSVTYMKLIAEIKKYEIIYNAAHPLRRKKSSLNLIWTQIASVLNDTVQKCKTRWKTLKARYESEYSKTTSDSAYKSNWVYMEEMSFMESYIMQQDNFLEHISKMSKRDIYCRACLRQVEGNITDLAVTSYDIFLTENFCEKYVQSTNQPSVPWDEYSHTVCGNCYEKVLDIHQFQVMCRESLEKFKIIMQPSKSQATPNMYQQEISESTSCTENNISEITNVDPSGHDADLLLDEIENRHTECTPPLENKCEADTLKKLQGDDVNLINDIFVNNKIVEILKEANCNGYDIDITDYNELLDSQEDNINEMEDEFIKCNDEGAIVMKRSETLDNINEVEEKISQGEESILDNYTKKSPGGHYKCKICAKSFKLKHCFEAHMRKHQGLREYACTFGDCTQSFSSLLRLQEHLKEHSGIRKIYKCELGNCNAVFSCYKTYRSHKRTVHKIFTKRPRKAKEKKSYACETCGKILSDRRSLTCHRYIHVDKSQWPFECDEENCTRRFRLKHLLLIHKRRHAGIKNYVCPICGARKTTSTELKIHINFHTFEQKFPCPSCPKVFKSVGCMRTHHNIVHDGKKPTYLKKKKEQFKCSYCDRILASAQNKKQHETSHTGIGFVTCDECGKKYPSVVLLKKHKDNMHYKGECEFVCEECGKKCKSAINLKSHLKTHFKGEPPYACDECGKRFKRAIYLENHKLLHVEGATPYKCDECGMGFRWMGTLYGHIKKHKQQQIKSEREDEDDVSEI